MAETGKPANKMARGRDDQTVSTPAIRHVGRTLESDPKYLEHVDGERGGLTPEAQIANIGASPDTTMGRAATDISADVSSTDDVSKGSRGKKRQA